MTRRITRWMLTAACAVMTGCDEATRALVYAGLEDGAQSVASALIQALFSMIGDSSST